MFSLLCLLEGGIALSLFSWDSLLLIEANWLSRSRLYRNPKRSLVPLARVVRSRTTTLTYHLLWDDLAWISASSVSWDFWANLLIPACFAGFFVFASVFVFVPSSCSCQFTCRASKVPFLSLNPSRSAELVVSISQCGNLSKIGVDCISPYKLCNDRKYSSNFVSSFLYRMCPALGFYLIVLGPGHTKTAEKK